MDSSLISLVVRTRHEGTAVIFTISLLISGGAKSSNYLHYPCRFSYYLQNLAYFIGQRLWVASFLLLKFPRYFPISHFITRTTTAMYPAISIGPHLLSLLAVGTLDFDLGFHTPPLGGGGDPAVLSPRLFSNHLRKLSRFTPAFCGLMQVVLRL